MLLKIHFQNAHKVLKFPEDCPDFLRFESFIRQLFDIQNSNLKISFVDQEGETVLLVDDYDLEYFQAHFSEEGVFEIKVEHLDNSSPSGSEKQKEDSENTTQENLSLKSKQSKSIDKIIKN